MKRLSLLLLLPFFIQCNSPQVTEPFQDIPDTYPTLQKVLSNPEI